MSMTASTIPGLFGPTVMPAAAAAPDPRAQPAAATQPRPSIFGWSDADPTTAAMKPAGEPAPMPSKPTLFGTAPIPTTTGAGAPGGPDLGLPTGTEPSAVTYDLGARLVHLFFDVVRFGRTFHAVATVTRFMVSNPITRPIAWLWLEVIKQLASLALGASRGLVEVVIEMMQPKIAVPTTET
ncbi:hypothetical protein AMAG_15436 [Allomyces macrogynus ATCC 38327]|uniref:Uncharacterized protein n=1 Tax=Allomyces macrogynus (strain ATCC 38327) TaxID=578462 RepID=A0A0L0T7G9_ALLM3|nr:hypothetical protein AMAG_15436 [Allomyces macrogynus ATCC 38327]|eukprot:KNE70680.1 hypothetical protein AMAG_15436 [Allomyces macrogynus ATCC 38327]